MKKWFSPKALIIFWSFVLFLAAVTIGGYLVLAGVYDGRVYPNIKLAGEGLTSQDEEGLINEVSNRSEELMSKEWTFSYNGQTLSISPQDSQAASIDLARPLIAADIEKTADLVWGIGRQGNFVLDWFTSLKTLIFSQNIPWQYSLDEERLAQLLQDKFGVSEKPMKNAGLEVTVKTDGSLETKNTSEQVGYGIDYVAAIQVLKEQIQSGDYQAIILSADNTEPKITLASLPATDNLSELLTAAPITIKDQNPASSSAFSVKADKQLVASWINYIIDTSGKVKVGFDQSRIEAWLTEKVAPQIDREPSPAKFEMKGSRVVNFQSSANGRQVDVTASAKKILETLEKKQPEVDLIIKVAVDDSVSPDSLGIKEIVGTGQSNFAGSPKNRRHNIAVGAAAVSGRLIKPGEEFSLVAAQGSVDKESGYLPELVIKDNKTIPEYGGGLCQVGTTLFRAALQSGLPITARRNHSYRVAYYEPAGMDAAIYIPQPDVRFLNDTKDYVLIQSRIEGDNLYFDFWGVKDGRQVNISKPVVYNIVKPAPTRFVSTTELKPGEKKCTEKAHNGADAYFDYQVVYNPGTDKEEAKDKRFSSHYVPWQEVCLVGAVPVTASTTASSTPENASSSASSSATSTN